MLSHPDLCVLAMTYMLHTKGGRGTEIKEVEEVCGLGLIDTHPD